MTDNLDQKTLMSGAPPRSLGEIFNVLWQRRRLGVGAAAGGFVVFFIIGLLQTPMYRSDALLQPVKEKAGIGISAFAQNLGGLGGLAGLSAASDERSAFAMAYLESFKNLNSFIKENNLAPKLFAGDWDSGKKAWESPSDVPTQSELYLEFRNRFALSLDGRTGHISVSLSWPDAQEGAQLLTKLIRRVNLDMRAQAIEVSTRNMAYLRGQLATERVSEVRETVSRMIQGEMEQLVGYSASEEFAFRNIDPPTVADRPHKPRKLLLAIVGALLGGIAASVFILGKDAISRRKI